jgi:hypothetical protein
VPVAQQQREEAVQLAKPGVTTTIIHVDPQNKPRISLITANLFRLAKIRVICG